MLDSSKVKLKVTQWFQNLISSPILSSCDHEYIFVNQVWERVEAKKYTLRNRFGCTKCKSLLTKDIGE